MEMITKPLKVRSKKVRESARGESCTLRVPGICCGNWETTVLAHVKAGGGGMGTKESDLSACYACATCHDAMDGRVQADVEPDEIYRAVMKTQHRLIEKGILKVEGHKHD